MPNYICIMDAVLPKNQFVGRFIDQSGGIFPSHPTPKPGAVTSSQSNFQILWHKLGLFNPFGAFYYPFTLPDFLRKALVDTET
jgi:hypothetical protein